MDDLASEGLGQYAGSIGLFFRSETGRAVLNREPVLQRREFRPAKYGLLAPFAAERAADFTVDSNF